MPFQRQAIQKQKALKANAVACNIMCISRLVVASERHIGKAAVSAEDQMS